MIAYSKCYSALLVCRKALYMCTIIQSITKYDITNMNVKDGVRWITRLVNNRSAFVPQEVKISSAPFLLLRIPSLKIKTTLRKETFEVNLKSEVDLWHLMVKEMWAGRKMADDHKVVCQNVTGSLGACQFIYIFFPELCTRSLLPTILGIGLVQAWALFHHTSYTVLDISFQISKWKWTRTPLGWKERELGHSFSLSRYPALHTTMYGQYVATL